MNILFFIILIIFAVCVIRGWQRSIFGLIYGVVTWVFMIVFVAIANPFIYVNLMANEKVHDAVYERVQPYAQKYVSETFEEKTTPKDDGKKNDDEKKSKKKEYVHVDKNVLDTLAEDLPAPIQNLIPEGGVDVSSDIVDKVKKGSPIEIPEKYAGLVEVLEDNGVDVSKYVDDLNSSIDGKIEKLKKAAIKAAAEEAAKRVMRAMSFLIAFLIAKAVCVIVWIVFKLTMKIGLFNKMGRALGAAVGAVEACLCTWAILFAVSLIRLSEQGDALYSQVQANPFLALMYDNNPLLKIFG